MADSPGSGSDSNLNRREVLQAFAAVSALGTQAFAASGQTPANTAAAPFDLAAVRLLPGPFATARDLDARYLLSLDPDRLLHNFRVNAGLEPKAPVYGGWESQQPWVDIRWQGHTLGHYLSACSMMAASTGEPRFLCTHNMLRLTRSLFLQQPS